MNEIPDYDAFAGLLNTTFDVQIEDGQSIDTQLVEISEQRLSAQQEIFSLVFRAPGDVALGQGMRHFHHENTGDFELFITPIRQDEQGSYYEAVFNLIRETSTPLA